MCKYEKDCCDKKVERVTTKFSNLREDPCERNDLSCKVYRLKRDIARTSVLDYEHQLKISS